MPMCLRDRAAVLPKKRQATAPKRLGDSGRVRSFTHFVSLTSGPCVHLLQAQVTQDLVRTDKEQVPSFARRASTHGT